MEKIDRAANEIREMDELSFLNSPIHNLHPLAKLLVTVIYILFVTSFSKYQLINLFPMILYPIMMFEISGISMKTCFYKMRFVLPLVMAVGIFNPLFDKIPYLYLGEVVITSGVISMLCLMLKGLLCVMASFIMIATTSIDSLCLALRLIHVPEIVVELILLTYRYISIMVEEVGVMSLAYKLRAPDQKGIKINAWGSFLGQLLLRSMDKAGELHMSMQLRGFNGSFYYSKKRSFGIKDFIYILVCVFMFVVVRYVNIPVLLGSMVVR